MRTTIFTRARWIAIGLALASLTAVYAQEALVFNRGVSITAGTLAITTRTINNLTLPNVTDTLVGKATTDTLTNKTLTAPILTVPLFTEFSEVVTATNVITAAETGSTFYLSAAGGFLSTLPAPALGLHFKFIVKTAPTSVGYTIATNASANIINGMMEERAGTAGVACATEDLLTLVANQAILGDWIEVRSDATNWYMYGMTDVAAAFTCALT